MNNLEINHSINNSHNAKMYEGKYGMKKIKIITIHVSIIYKKSFKKNAEQPITLY